MMIRLKTTEDIWATWMFIQDVPGVGPSRIRELYQKTESIHNLIEYILSEANKNSPLWQQRLYSALLNLDLTSYYRIINNTLINGAHITTYDDPLYPRNLLRSKSAPPVLFYKGSIEGISTDSLAIVGTLAPSEEGKSRAFKFARLCVENNIQVVSGLARGIDTISHISALHHGGKTYAVVGHGIDYCYPKENATLFEMIVKTGAIISQFPTGTKPSRWMFPARNETMCTLSSGTVIVEAHEKCGSIIQANYSFRHGRPVYIMRSSVRADLTWAKDIVKKGGVIVNNFQDVLNSHNKQPQSTDTKQQSFNFSSPSRAYLFDMDGVLYDGILLMKRVYMELVQEYRGSVSQADINTIDLQFNNAPSYVLNHLKITDSAAPQKYKALLHSYLKKGEFNFFPGINELISSLKQQGHMVGIVTSRPMSSYKLVSSRAPYKDLIDVAITWNDVSKAKPDPEGISKAINRLGICPSNSVYIGDDDKDIQAAKNAGTYSIAALWGSYTKERLVNADPDFIAKSPADILKFVF